MPIIVYLFSCSKYTYCVFYLQIVLDEHFPFTKPGITCKTPIYHPNIDTVSGNGSVCFTLTQDWNSNMGLQDIVQGLLFLLYNPQLDDPLVDYVFPECRETFEQNVRLANEGKLNPQDVAAAVGEEMDEDELKLTWFDHTKVLNKDNWDGRDFVPIQSEVAVPIKTLMRRVDSIINKSSQKWTEMEQWQSCAGMVPAGFGAHPIAY